MKPKNKISYRNQEWCVDCDCPATKRCRGCGKPLCAFCAKSDGMCKSCSRDAVEYVDEDYRHTTVQAY